MAMFAAERIEADSKMAAVERRGRQAFFFGVLTGMEVKGRKNVGGILSMDTVNFSYIDL